MNTEQKNKFPRKSLILISIWAGILILFVFGVIFTQKQTLSYLDQEIRTLEPRIATHQMLLPFYETLERQLGSTASGESVPTLETPAACEDLYRLPIIFEENARICNLRLENINQDINAISDRKGTMKMDLYATGNFYNFREFLFQISELSCLEKVEKLDINSNINSEDLTLHMRLCFVDSKK